MRRCTINCLRPCTPISDERVKYVVNTHLHGDYTAGDTAFAQEGALSIAWVNMRERMLAQAKPLPAAAIPVLAHEDSMTIHMNGETIDIFWPEPACTDGDSLIYFRNANIRQTGDAPSSLRYPNIGVNDGGTVAGMMAARAAGAIPAAKFVALVHTDLVKPW